MIDLYIAEIYNFSTYEQKNEKRAIEDTAKLVDKHHRKIH